MAFCKIIVPFSPRRPERQIETQKAALLRQSYPRAAKETIDGFYQSARNFAAPTAGHQLFFILAVGQKSKLDQHRWHIRRFEHPKARKAMSAVQ